MPPPSLRQVNNVICCLTCAIAQSTAALTDAAKADAIWNVSWNVSIPAEEDEALAHAQANPKHIMVKSLDWGYTVNGV